MTEQQPTAPPPYAEPAVEFEGVEVDAPPVGIVMGSKSDMPEMEKAEEELHERGISCEVRVMSAHREPDTVADYARNARVRGLRVIIAGAGLSAALPGVVAAHTDLPVIGVPLTSRTSVAGGLDALLSISQMPPGVPVAVRRGRQPAERGLLAARIISEQARARAPRRDRPLHATADRRPSGRTRRAWRYWRRVEVAALRGDGRPDRRGARAQSAPRAPASTRSPSASRSPTTTWPASSTCSPSRAWDRRGAGFITA